MLEITGHVFPVVAMMITHLMMVQLNLRRKQNLVSIVHTFLCYMIFYFVFVYNYIAVSLPQPSN